MGLINDHQVEMAYPETLDAMAIFRIDEVHHRRIGGEKHSPFSTAVDHEVHRGTIRQKATKGALGLKHQGRAVSQEQHPLDPVTAA